MTLKFDKKKKKQFYLCNHNRDFKISICILLYSNFSEEYVIHTVLFVYGLIDFRQLLIIIIIL